MSKRTLVTGFGPFLDVAENPSARLAESLDRPYQIIAVSYEAAEALVGGLAADSFDRILLMGVAAKRSHLSLETVARNACGSTPDVSGSERSGMIRAGGPATLRSTLFQPDRLPSLLEIDPVLRASEDAGAYLCNFLYFLTLEAFPSKQVGFLHVPGFEEVPYEAQLSVIRSLLAALEEQ